MKGFFMDRDTRVEIVKTHCHKVTKSNDIIRKAKNGMTLQEQKIIAYLIAQIRPTETDRNKYYVFDTKKFCLVCGIEVKNYINIRRILKKLFDRESIEIFENGCYCPVKWIGDYKIEPDASKVSVQLHFRIVPYLLELKKNFTSYYFGEVAEMKNKYSISLYELFASYAFKGSFEISIDELKTYLNIEGYEAYKIFKRNILNKSIEEINDKTDMRIKVEEIRHGRKIAVLRFLIEDYTK